mgnify:CR=1 FL=1
MSRSHSLRAPKSEILSRATQAGSMVSGSIFVRKTSEPLSGA